MVFPESVGVDSEDNTPFTLILLGFSGTVVPVIVGCGDDDGDGDGDGDGVGV